ncbi:Aste57867_20659 [Aphanomyces stellatus]|uniref:folate gamma-glutamyl hydrolase n=1 Tax=Aphanomyces stellatus TaxID=120398 RepID=A0A485LFG7_9STRA|nr:hypothetical protein As57867_020591 [Aphanomyces stellatus]VFT97339.1 Aste57867_20659 [Aphanomyces stellatus]
MTTVRTPILLRRDPAADSTTARRIQLSLLMGSLVLFLCGMSLTRSSPLSRPAVALSSVPTTRTPNPIIAVHSHQDPDYDDEFIAASYIKWIESAGGRAVRIPWNASKDETARLLTSVNGLLLPGGDPDPNESAAFMYNFALELNRNGSYFPVWGTCLGFEWLLQLQSTNAKILDNVDAQNLSSTIEFLGPRRESRLFGFDPVFDILTTEPITDNFHHFGILLDHFQATDSISSFFKPLATSQDRQGQTYVAAMEAFKWPVYGVQFHPEKNPYEFGVYEDGIAYETIDHSPAAIATSQAFAAFFISEATKNSHAFATADEAHTALLYNAKRSDRSYPMYEEVFVFE